MSNKTHKGLAKRLKRSRTGKLFHKPNGKRHLLSNKSSKRRRGLGQWRQLPKSVQKSFERQYGTA